MRKGSPMPLHASQSFGHAPASSAVVYERSSKSTATERVRRIVCIIRRGLRQGVLMEVLNMPLSGCVLSSLCALLK